MRIFGAGDWGPLKRKYDQMRGICFEGYCKDLESAYRESLFSVAPIYGGSGTKIKVLESLYYGRTVVGTAQAFSGHDALQHDRSAKIAKSDTELIDSCIELLRSPRKCQEMAREGQKVLHKVYSFEAFAAVVKRAVKEAVSQTA